MPLKCWEQSTHWMVVVSCVDFCFSLGSIITGVKENVFPTTCGNVENFILNDIILFYFIYFIIPMMLWVYMPLRSYVVIEPYYVLADGTANYFLSFILIIILLLLMLLSLD